MFLFSHDVNANPLLDGDTGGDLTSDRLVEDPTQSVSFAVLKEYNQDPIVGFFPGPHFITTLHEADGSKNGQSSLSTLFISVFKEPSLAFVLDTCC